MHPDTAPTFLALVWPRQASACCCNHLFLFTATHTAATGTGAVKLPGPELPSPPDASAASRLLIPSEAHPEVLTQGFFLRIFTTALPLRTQLQLLLPCKDQ